MNLRTIRSRLLSGLVGIVLVVGGCAPVAALVTPSPQVTQTLPPSPLFTAEAFTATPSPSATPLPSPLPLPSATATQAGITRSNNFVRGCDWSAFVSDVTIPDGIVLAPGTVFTKTWELRNTGSCAWLTTYSMTFLGGHKMGGSNTEINQFVKPGETARISVTLKAPYGPGVYIGYWILSNKAGIPFGQRVFILIVVSDEAE